MGNHQRHFVFEVDFNLDRLGGDVSRSDDYVSEHDWRPVNVVFWDDTGEQLFDWKGENVGWPVPLEESLVVSSHLLGVDEQDGDFSRLWIPLFGYHQLGEMPQRVYLDVG